MGRDGTADLGHGGEDGGEALVGSQLLQPLLCGQLHVDADAVRQIPGPGQKLLRRAGDSLHMDVTPETVPGPQEQQSFTDLLHGVGRIPQDAGA